MLRQHLALIAAPMVNQSDLPFRILVRKYGASLAYTQVCSHTQFWIRRLVINTSIIDAYARSTSE
jgi:tRNA-dihydrouridine synthase